MMVAPNPNAFVAPAPNPNMFVNPAPNPNAFVAPAPNPNMFVNPSSNPNIGAPTLDRQTGLREPSFAQKTSIINSFNKSLSQNKALLNDYETRDKFGFMDDQP
jgi:hypothetical protein